MFSNFWTGNEGRGVSKTVRDNSHQTFILPMAGFTQSYKYVVSMLPHFVVLVSLGLMKLG